MKPAIVSIGALLAMTALSGCGTLQCCSADDVETWPIYGGVAYDLKQIEDTAVGAPPRQGRPDAKSDRGAPPPWQIAITRACDLPLSAAADTLLLPVTVTYSVAKGLDRVDDAPLWSQQAWERFWGLEPPPPEPPSRSVSAGR